MNETSRAANATRRNPLVRGLARAGFAANGVVHALIGTIIVEITAGGRGEADQVGALQAVASAPLGVVAVWAAAIGLWGLALWHLAAGISARGDGKWGRRLSEGGQAIAFAAIGVLSASIALGARPDADTGARDASRGLLAVPGGVVVLGTLGVGIGIAGIAFVVMGVRRSFQTRMSIPHTPLGTAARILGVIGFIAKGAALGILGVLLIVAAWRTDAMRAGGLDSAVDGLLTVPFGRVIATTIGAGLIVYGTFCGFRARYARL